MNPNRGNLMNSPIDIRIHPDVRLHKVSKYIYGHFAEHLGRCIYDGIWVGEDSSIKNDNGIRLDTFSALKEVALPVLRWPGGCFADNYHWMDGIGDRAKRPRRQNLWWNQPESNHFGTDEFVRFCRMIEAEPYICLNVGSGSVEEAMGWVEYCNSDQSTILTDMRRENGYAEPHNVRFWGIGNENWGCGGNMNPEFYANLYLQYATYVRRIAGDGSHLVACGSHHTIDEWDERFLCAIKGKSNLVDSIAVHVYLGQGSNDIDFPDEDYYRLLDSISKFDRTLKRAIGLAEAHSTYGHQIRVIMDEWGTWFAQVTVKSGLYQQSTMRDALFTAASFHLFHKLGESLYMTNMAQTINVLQALVLTKGPKLLKTPTYHVYEMFRPHRDGHLVSCSITGCPELPQSNAMKQSCVSVSTTVSEDGTGLTVSLVNLHLSQPCQINLSLQSSQEWKIAKARRLTANDIRSHNTFENPANVQPQDINISDKEISDLKLPAMSITTIQLNKVDPSS